jgi:hypothetical protein
MDIATIGMKALRAEGRLADLDVSEEINACSIRVPVRVRTGRRSGCCCSRTRHTTTP